MAEPFETENVAISDVSLEGNPCSNFIYLLSGDWTLASTILGSGGRCARRLLCRRLCLFLYIYHATTLQSPVKPAVIIDPNKSTGIRFHLLDPLRVSAGEISIKVIAKEVEVLLNSSL